MATKSRPKARPVTKASGNKSSKGVIESTHPKHAKAATRDTARAAVKSAAKKKPIPAAKPTRTQGTMQPTRTSGAMGKGGTSGWDNPAVQGALKYERGLGARKTAQKQMNKVGATATKTAKTLSGAITTKPLTKTQKVTHGVTNAARKVSDAYDNKVEQTVNKATKTAKKLKKKF